MVQKIVVVGHSGLAAMLECQQAQLIAAPDEMSLRDAVTAAGSDGTPPSAIGLVYPWDIMDNVAGVSQQLMGLQYRVVVIVDNESVNPAIFQGIPVAGPDSTVNSLAALITQVMGVVVTEAGVEEEMHEPQYEQPQQQQQPQYYEPQNEQSGMFADPAYSDSGQAQSPYEQPQYGQHGRSEPDTRVEFVAEIEDDAPWSSTDNFEGFAPPPQSQYGSPSMNAGFNTPSDSGDSGGFTNLPPAGELSSFSSDPFAPPQQPVNEPVQYETQSQTYFEEPPPVESQQFVPQQQPEGSFAHEDPFEQSFVPQQQPPSQMSQQSDPWGSGDEQTPTTLYEEQATPGFSYHESQQSEVDPFSREQSPFVPSAPTEPAYYPLQGQDPFAPQAPQAPPQGPPQQGQNPFGQQESLEPLGQPFAPPQGQDPFAPQAPQGPPQGPPQQPQGYPPQGQDPFGQQGQHQQDPFTAPQRPQGYPPQGQDPFAPQAPQAPPQGPPQGPSQGPSQQGQDPFGQQGQHQQDPFTAPQQPQGYPPQGQDPFVPQAPQAPPQGPPQQPQGYPPQGPPQQPQGYPPQGQDPFGQQGQYQQDPFAAPQRPTPPPVPQDPFAAQPPPPQSVTPNSMMGGHGPSTDFSSQYGGGQQRTRKAQVHSFAVPKGGTGKSSLAAIYSAVLSQGLRAGLADTEPGPRVLLIDANVQQADSRRIMGLRPQRTILDLARTVFDENTIESYLTPPSPANPMWLLPGPMNKAEADPNLITPALYRRVTDLLLPLFDHIIIDTPEARLYDPMLADYAMPVTDWLIVPVLQNRPVLDGTKEWLQLIQAPRHVGGYAFDPAKVRLVMNMVRESIGYNTESLSVDLASWEFAGEVAYSDQVARATNEYRLPLDDKPLVDSVRRVIYTVTGNPVFNPVDSDNVRGKKGKGRSKNGGGASGLFKKMIS